MFLWIYFCKFVYKFMTMDKIQILGEMEFINVVLDNLSLDKEFLDRFESEINLVILDMYDIHYYNGVSVLKIVDVILSFLENFFDYEI